MGDIARKVGRGGFLSHPLAIAETRTSTSPPLSREGGRRGYGRGARCIPGSDIRGWEEKRPGKGRRRSWLQVVAFDGVAKSIADLGKGDLVGVVGRLRSNTWEKDGVSRTTVEVVAQSVEFLRLKAWAAGGETAAA